MNLITLLVGALMAFGGPKSAPVDPVKWDLYKQLHNKSYQSEEVDSMRRDIFARNVLLINKFNEQQRDATFSLALNHMADLSSVDIKTMNGFKMPDGDHEEILRNSQEAEQFLNKIYESNVTVPDSVDWRNVPNRVSGVKNQGMCGSCWAFASTGVLEGQEKRNLVELSEQNLVDCVKADYGCQGGFMKDALEFVKQEEGIDDESSYPYEAAQRRCRYKKENSVLSDNGAAILPTGDEQKLKEVVAKFGPVAVAIDASSLWFQFYRHGVYYNKHCHNKEKQLDHGVLVVGYGTDPKKGDYWIVKNSWGKGFGEKGYIKMARNRNNNCGIATVATIPIFA